jgi:hypothetical protein
MKYLTELIVIAALVVATLPTAAWSQSPLDPPGAPGIPFLPWEPPGAPSQQPPTPTPYGPQPGQPQYPAAQQQQQEAYAFRPDLTNPQYGECLGLEKTWKILWQRYAQGYQQMQSASPSDPRYVQMSYYLADLRRQLDAAWNVFSSKCIYFRSRR